MKDINIALLVQKFAEKSEFFLLDKAVKLVGGGSVINGPTLSSLDTSWIIWLDSVHLVVLMIMNNLFMVSYPASPVPEFLKYPGIQKCSLHLA